MKSLTHRSLKIFTVLGLICLFVPVFVMGLWIHAFNLGTTQIDRVAIFNSYFPDSLDGRRDITFISIAFCNSAIILSNISMKLHGKLWKALNVIIMVFSILLLSLNLFSMM
jgi:hypothetical protein